MTDLNQQQTVDLLDFKPFGRAVNKSFTALSRHELFVAGNSPDALWTTYLAAFPEGSNRIYRKRTEHDCSCCRNFVRNLGAVVSIEADGSIKTVWDIAGLHSPYKEVAQAMSAFVRSQSITSVFRTKQPSYGAESTRELRDDQSVHTWNHFHASIGNHHLSQTPADARGELNTAAQVFRRGLEELSVSAIDTVLGLIDQNAIYRGAEHKRAVVEFRQQQQQFLAITDERKRAAFAFLNASSLAARFRNTVIGTLVQDLSAGVDIEAAVRSFESKVAPTNYKRTTSLITPLMVRDAMQTIDELGLREALERRLARLSDISINNVLWADNSAAALMKDGIEAALMSAVKAGPPSGKAQDISVSDFMLEVAPRARSMEVLVSNTHAANFVTLTAPKHPGSARLFRWNNDFAWSYDGNVTDSIREKVKAAGGDVDAKLRFSLAWHNHDDLDLHVYEPCGTHIHYASKLGRNGALDVDMNAGYGRSREPVENVAFRHLVDGDYRVLVNQYARRETADTGFSVEVADGAQVMQLSCFQSPPAGNVEVGTFRVMGGVIVKHALGPKMQGGGMPQTKWGVRTETMVKVQTVMASPNHWDGNTVGNKHWFFMLDDCKVAEPVRGIYNEFLKSELEKHRKVFEVLGDKTKCAVTVDQLSGLGFSSTRGDTVAISVSTSEGATRRFNVRF